MDPHNKTIENPKKSKERESDLGKERLEANECDEDDWCNLVEKERKKEEWENQWNCGSMK